MAGTLDPEWHYVPIWGFVRSAPTRRPPLEAGLPRRQLEVSPVSDGSRPDEAARDEDAEEVLVEEVSIDGMCGVY